LNALGKLAQYPAHRHAELDPPLADADDLAVPQQRLGGDAAPVEADPARSIVLYGRHREAKLGAADRRHVPAGPGPHDDRVELLVSRHANAPAAPPGVRAISSPA